jgi:hypothetical protein
MVHVTFITTIACCHLCTVYLVRLCVQSSVVQLLQHIQPLLFTAYTTVTLTKNSTQTDVDIIYDNKLIRTPYDTKNRIK